MTEKRKPLLIVEDDPALQKQMLWAFDKYETTGAADRESAIAQLRRCEPAVVTMDLGLPPHPDDPREGLQLLEEIHELAPDTKVIVLTGQNDRANALRAIALGAYDFCTKPFETTKKQGMGIGVYESSQYVVGLGGQLLVDSTPGIGTRVSVLLPLADGASAASAPMKEVA
jgi:CheY-like chemotaxis protein